MTDGDFLDWVKSTLYEAERALLESKTGRGAQRWSEWTRRGPDRARSPLAAPGSLRDQIARRGAWVARKVKGRS